MVSILQTAFELGLISSLTVLALFLSYSMLNVCDLSTDGCFTLGAAVGAVVALAGHPFLSLPAAMGAEYRALFHQHLGDGRGFPAQHEQDCHSFHGDERSAS